MKKMRYFISVFLFIVFITLANINTCLASTVKLTQIAESNDSTNAINSIKNFLIWYEINYKKSSAFRLVSTDKNDHYIVDKKGCKKYLKHLKSSGYISNAHIQKWREYFTKMEQNFRDKPQNEGPPEGFDYDLISGTQEPELFYHPTENLTFINIEIEKTTAIIKSIDIWKHQYTLSKSNGKWKIDSIEILGYPTDSNPK